MGDGRSLVTELSDALEELPGMVGVPCVCHASRRGFGQHMCVLTGERDAQGRYIYREGGAQ